MPFPTSAGPIQLTVCPCAALHQHPRSATHRTLCQGREYPRVSVRPTISAVGSDRPRAPDRTYLQKPPCTLPILLETNRVAVNWWRGSLKVLGSFHRTIILFARRAAKCLRGYRPARMPTRHSMVRSHWVGVYWKENPAGDEPTGFVSNSYLATDFMRGPTPRYASQQPLLD
jgi:hypothetical protein